MEHLPLKVKHLHWFNLFLVEVNQGSDAVQYWRQRSAWNDAPKICAADRQVDLIKFPTDSQTVIEVLA